MARPVLTLANTYTLIVEVENNQTGGIFWRNTWDIHATSVPGPTDTIIDKIIEFHQSNVRDEVFISRCILRNWSQGPQPFASRPFLWERFLGAGAFQGTKSTPSPQGYGSQSAGTQLMPGELVAFAKRTTQGQAKPSNMFLRGLLDDADVYAYTGGKWLEAPGAAVTAGAFAATVGNTIAPYMGAALDPGLVLVHVGNHYAGPAFSTPMIGLSYVGPSSNKTTRKNRK